MIKLSNGRQFNEVPWHVWSWTLWALRAVKQGDALTAKHEAKAAVRAAFSYVAKAPRPRVFRGRRRPLDVATGTWAPYVPTDWDVRFQRESMEAKVREAKEDVARGVAICATIQARLAVHYYHELLALEAQR